MNRRGRRSNKLKLVIDFGGSMTKAIGGVSMNERYVLAMEPDVIEIPKGLVQPIDDGLSCSNLSDSAWVELKETTYAVGYLARSCSRANPRLSQLKRDIAVYKVAAAIWVIKEKLQMPSSLNLDLACLLPVGEYEDSGKLFEQLQENLAQFETPTGLITVELKSFNCKPEGAGIFLRHQAKQGKAAIARTHLAIIMVGYRNTSVMIFRRGRRAQSLTSDLGFASLVKNVVSRTSGQTLERLTPVLAQYLEQKNVQVLHGVLLSADTDYELEKLKQAIALATQQYQLELSQWLTEAIPRSVTEIVLSGGTVDTFKSFFFDQFGGKTVYLHAQVELPEDVLALSMSKRFADIWVMWDYFLEKLEFNPQSPKTA